MADSFAAGVLDGSLGTPIWKVVVSCELPVCGLSCSPGGPGEAKMPDSASGVQPPVRVVLRSDRGSPNAGQGPGYVFLTSTALLLAS